MSLKTDNSEIDNQQAILDLYITHGGDINFSNANGETVIWKAVEDDNSKLVKLLLDAGAEVQNSNKKGDFLPSKATSKEVLIQLLKAGVKFYQSNQFGWSFIYDNALKLDKEIVDLSLIDLHCVNEDGENPILTKLHDTFVWDKFFAESDDIIKLLRFYKNIGLDLSSVSKVGRNLLHSLYYNHYGTDNSEVMRLLENKIESLKEVEQYLLEIGIDGSQKDKWGKTYLDDKESLSSMVEDYKKELLKAIEEPTFSSDLDDEIPF